VVAAEGSISFELLEQLSNLRTRVARESVEHAALEVDRLRLTRSAEGGARRAAGGKTLAQQRTEAGKRLRAEAAAARVIIREEMARRDQMSAFQRTSERESLRGGALKRLAMIERRVGRASAASTAVKQMTECYRSALDLAVAQGASAS